MVIRQATFVVILVCLVTATALAQTFSVAGRVADPQDGAVNDAVVTLISSGGGPIPERRVPALTGHSR